MLFRKNHLHLIESQRDAMRVAGRFNAQLMDYVRPFVKPGITTGEIDRLVYDYTIQHNHRPSQLNYRVGDAVYRRSCCTSVNDVICHGIPGDYVLTEGDIVNVDLTTTVNGWHGDQSETFLIGQVSLAARMVTQCAFDAMHRAIDSVYPGCQVAEIGRAVLAQAKTVGFSVVRDYVGHGLGRRFHQDPSIPHYLTAQARIDRLHPGMCFTVEPMINTGVRFSVQDKKDGWTVRTKDGGLSAQFEHTVLMTEAGPEILTLTKDGPQKGHRF